MASTQVTPTRMELTRTKKKLVTAIKGHKLLKDKRDELMRQFLDLVKVNMELREKVEAGIRSANKNFVIAKAGMDEATLNTALMAPKQEVDLEVGQKNVMSVDIPVFETKTRTADANDIYSYGFAFTSSDLDGAVKSLADILPDMLKLAEYLTKDEHTTETKKDGTKSKPRIKESDFHGSQNMPLPKPHPDKLYRWKKEIKPKKGYYIARMWEGINPKTGYKYRRYTMIKLNRRI